MGSREDSRFRKESIRDQPRNLGEFVYGVWTARRRGNLAGSATS